MGWCMEGIRGSREVVEFFHGRCLDMLGLGGNNSVEEKRCSKERETVRVKSLGSKGRWVASGTQDKKKGRIGSFRCGQATGVP